MKTTISCAAALLAAVPALAQDKAERVIPLKVQLVLSKVKGETKTASLPYSLPCNAEEPARGSHLRMGIDVPVLTAAKEGPPAYQYRSVGTNIDCRASAMSDGRYRLEMTVEHSSMYAPPDESTRAAVGAAPLFRTFRSGFVPVLRDGQSMQYTMATDPVSGEVVRIDVTLAVVK
jgi:hypothetical protein